MRLSVLGQGHTAFLLEKAPLRLVTLILFLYFGEPEQGLDQDRGQSDRIRVVILYSVLGGSWWAIKWGFFVLV